MKVVTEGWTPIFALLPCWERLPLAARTFFLELEGDLRVRSERLASPPVAALRDGGFLRCPGYPTADGIMPFRRFVRALSRHPFFDGDTVDLDAYLPEHLTHAEVQLVQDLHGYYGVRWNEIAKRVSDEAWVLGLLNEKSPALWEKRHVPDAVERFLENPAAGRFLTTWIRRLLEQGNPVALSEIVQAAADDPEAAGAALSAGIRYAFLFPSLRSGTLNPVIGLLPGVHHRLTRKRPTKPVVFDAPPVGAEVFDTPYLMQDMTTGLVQLEPDGVRLTAQGAVFKREADRMIAALPVFPAQFRLPSADSRWSDAMFWLRRLGFAKAGARGKASCWIKVTADGRKWLVGSVGERLRTLLDALRAANARSRKSNRGWDSLTFTTGSVFSGYGDERAVEPDRRLVEAFAALEPGQWVATAEFLAWQAETENPLLACPAPSNAGHIFIFSAEDQEKRWYNYVEGFLKDRLIPLGGVRLALTSDGGHWFALTPVGAYLLGRTDVFEYVHPDTPGHMVVQPNFDIVFTGQAPAVEGELAVFAVRVGHGVGTLFRITRASVLAAVEAGVAGDEILERLSRCSHKAVPANVAAQIKDWAASHRRVTVRSMLTLRCPDAETAARVRALFPQLIKPVAGNLLEITNAASLPAVRKKLKNEGIGVRKAED